MDYEHVNVDVYFDVMHTRNNQQGQFVLVYV